MGQCGNQRKHHRRQTARPQSARTVEVLPCQGGTNSITSYLTLGYSASGTYSLNGGLLKAKVLQGSGTGTSNVNGGTLQAAGNDSSYLNGLTAANVQAGGAVIDVQSFNDTIGQNLRHDPALGGTPDGGLTKLGSGVLTLSGTNTFTGATIVSDGTLQVTGALANNSSSKVFVVKDPTGLPGGDRVAIVRRVTTGGGYGGLGSSVTNLDTGELATAADILDGAASAQADVSMAWRTRSAAEKTRAGGGLLSEVLNLQGVAPSGGGLFHGSVQTDPFVLQLSYDHAQLQSIWGRSEADAAAQGLLFLGYHDLGADGNVGTADDRWVNAVYGNFAGTANYVGNQPYNASLFALGNFGVDTSNHVVWAVVDHNSEFAVVPEPGTLALLAAVAAGLLVRGRRHRRSTD